MIRTVIFDDEIKLWWGFHPLQANERFVVELDNEKFFTKASHFNCKQLLPEREYTFALGIENDNGDLVCDFGKITAKTCARKRNLDVTKPPYNAVGDGVTLNTLAIQKAIDDCGQDQRVFFPDGVYLCGALNLKSNLEVYLSNEAVLQGTDNPADYLPKIKSRFEGVEEWCYRSLLNSGELDEVGGCNCENITIRGGKILGGGASLRQNIIDTERLDVLKEYGLEKYASPPAYYYTTLPGRRRGRLFHCANTKNVIVANSFVGNAPSWNLHFIYCEDVITCGCTIYSPQIKNGDGWDPDSSKNCILFDIDFDTGDDCVAIKSGKNWEGYTVNRPCENIKIFDCVARGGHGIAIGSEMSGGVKDVVIWNCMIHKDVGFSIKTHKDRGGYVENIQVFHCSFPTLFVGVYDGNDGGEPAPVEPKVSNLHFEDIRVSGIWVFTGNGDRQILENAVTVCGYSKENCVENVTIKNLTMKYRQQAPYQVLRFSNVNNLQLKNIVTKGEI